MNKLRNRTRQRFTRLEFLSVLAALLAVPLPAIAQSVDGDTRDTFIVRPYVGLGIDSFSAGDVSEYLNQGESGDIEERFTAGIEFSYRLMGDKSDSKQLWVWGRTTHGVRSTDVDCRASPDDPLCTPFSLELEDPTERGLYILRNSSTLEGIGGLRWEFAKLQVGSNAPARAFVSAQAGFVSVSDGPDDVAGIHHIGLGAIITEGKFERSYLEVGYGTNDLILENSNERFKLNARVAKKITGWMGGFAHISVDVDGGDGSDSIQTYLGLYFTIGD